MQGFARICAAVPSCRVADFAANREAVLELWGRAHQQGAALVVFPELALSAYSARDLLLDGHLQTTCLQSLGLLASQGCDLGPLAIVGLPLRVGSALFNVAAAIQQGRVLAIIPKLYLPNHREFEEARWFRSGAEIAAGSSIDLFGYSVPMGTDLLLRADQQPDLVVGVEICEDGWVPVPPSAIQVVAGATVICNLSASNFTIGKAELRRLLVRSASDRGKCAYVYVGAGPGESSTDLAFDADAFICENGRELACSERFSRDDQLISVDIDLDLLVRERLTTTSFGQCAHQQRFCFRSVSFSSRPMPPAPLQRKIDAHPFLPTNSKVLARRCWEIFEIQTNALITRMRAASLECLVLGLSGGVDSTHAALVCAAALDLMNLPRTQLRCITMPGLGTTERTRSSAERLAHALGASFDCIDISEATRIVLSAVGHAAADGVEDVPSLLGRLRDDPDRGDVVLENAQARLRTLLLMTIANQSGGLVVGTGDLSEKALGWATYAGDQISMYDVNAGVPKTLIQFVIRWVANERAARWTTGDVELLRQTLFGILDTPISPELLPVGADGQIAQLTESAVGPFELHDFFLYHFIRHGARPSRILDLAQVAFADRYSLPDLKRWLAEFFQRFFRSQFKRSCTADGPKVGMVALSPRGDWRMPSDAEVSSWLEEIQGYESRQ